MKLTCDFSMTSARHHPVASTTPWYEPWLSPDSSTVPGLVLDFASGTYGSGGAKGTLENSIAFSRLGSATRTNAAGVLEVQGTDVARIDHDPVGFARQGLMLETARTNLFVQSGSPATQTIVVNSVPHVLSFYGAGTITLAGAHVATVVGTGAYPARTMLVFTPTAGNLILTLSGIVESPQLEEGDIPSSFVPTGAAATARNDDVASVPLGPWFNTTAGTLVFDGVLDHALANDRIIEIDGGATSTRLSVLWNTVLNKPQFQVWEAGVLQAAIAPPGNSIGFGNAFRVALTYSVDDFAISLNGSSVAIDTLGVVPTGLTTLRIGRSVWGAQGLMLAKKVLYYPGRLSNSELQAISA